jgi:hypothetical protein
MREGGASMSDLRQQTAAELKQLAADVSRHQSEGQRLFRRCLAMRGFVFDDSDESVRDDLYTLADALILTIHAAVETHLYLADTRSGIGRDPDRLAAFVDSIPGLYRNFHLKVVRPDDDGPKAA